MAENEGTTAATPAPPPEARDHLLRDLVETLKAGQTIQEQLLKEHTQAVAANTRAMLDLRDAIEGLPPSQEHPEGVDGLIDIIADLESAADPLGDAVTATNVMLARYAYVFDTLTDINTGDPEAPEIQAGADPTPGAVYKEGRSPSLVDIVAALRKFDQEAEAEAKKEDEEHAKAEAEAKERSRPKAPLKPAMMSNAPKKGPGLRALPPLPVAPPRPTEASTT